MNYYSERRELVRFGRLHTFDILIHLLESVALRRLTEADAGNEVPQCGPETSPPPHLCWRVAWEFLRSEEFIVTTGDAIAPGPLYLSKVGEELLEELTEARLDPGAALYPNDSKGLCSERAITFEDVVDTDFQECVYRSIRVKPMDLCSELELAV